MHNLNNVYLLYQYLRSWILSETQTSIEQIRNKRPRPLMSAWFICIFLFRSTATPCPDTGHIQTSAPNDPNMTLNTEKSKILHIYKLQKTRGPWALTLCLRTATWPLGKVPEVAHMPPFPTGSKLSLFSLYRQWFPKYGPDFQNCHIWA